MASNMKRFSAVFFVCIAPLMMLSCGSSSSKEKNEADVPTSLPPVDMQPFLSADQLIELSAYSDLAGIQLYMKDKAPGFVNAKKGEFASMERSAIVDTAGASFELTSSTFYISTDPMEDWRTAHTIHSDSLNNKLMSEFQAKQFLLTDSSYDKQKKAMKYFYASSSHPGKKLVYVKTYSPWPSKGIYVNAITWPCYVYEVVAEK